MGEGLWGAVPVRRCSRGSGRCRHRAGQLRDRDREPWRGHGRPPRRQGLGWKRRHRGLGPGRSGPSRLHGWRGLGWKHRRRGLGHGCSGL